MCPLDFIAHHVLKMATPDSLRKIPTAAVIGLCATPLTSFGQAPEGDAATIAALREQVAALTRRLDEVERRQAAEAPENKPARTVGKSPDAALQAELREARAAAKEARAAATEAKTAQQKIEAAPVTGPVIDSGTIAGSGHRHCAATSPSLTHGRTIRTTPQISPPAPVPPLR